MKKSKPAPQSKPFTTAHKLDFESSPWHRSDDFFMFRIGTCHGLWRATHVTYDILAVYNDQRGNGHFEDVMQWFSHSCRRDEKYLRIMEIMNEDFLRHLIEKRGFTAEGDHCIKKFT